MVAAITSVYAVITPWMTVTVVSKSSTRAPIDTFITLASTAIRNCVRASKPRTAFPASRPEFPSNELMTRWTARGRSRAVTRSRACRV
jgi:hypothetical protein